MPTVEKQPGTSGAGDSSGNKDGFNVPLPILFVVMGLLFAAYYYFAD